MPPPRPRAADAFDAVVTPPRPSQTNSLRAAYDNDAARVAELMAVMPPELWERQDPHGNNVSI